MDGDFSVPIVSLPSSSGGTTALILKDGCFYQLNNISGDGDASRTQSFISVGQDDSQDSSILHSSAVNGIIVDTDKGIVCMNVDGSDVGNSAMQFANLTSAELQTLHSSGPLRLLGGGDGLVTSQASSLFDSQNVVSSEDSGGHLELDTHTQILTTEVEASESEKVTKKSKKGGWPKGKKRKNPPEYAKTPKPPMIAYVIYASERRADLKETNPDASFTEVTRIIGKEWSKLAPDVKQKYQGLAEKDQERYINDMKKYQQTDEFKLWLSRKRGRDSHSLSDVAAEYAPDSLDSAAPLYCKWCNQYFSSHHNRKEHFLGKTHLNNVASEFKKAVEKGEIAEEKEKESDPPPSDHPYVPVGFKPISEEEDIFSVDVFLASFLEKNYEREMEIQSLRGTLQANIKKSQTLQEKVKELKELENKLEQDVSTLNAYGAALSAQIDGLRMVPTLFGVINF